MLPRIRGLDSKLSVALAGIFVTFRTESLQIFARLPTDTDAVTIPGLFSCTHLHANAQVDTQAGPSKITLIRLVAFFLCFGFPKL